MSHFTRNTILSALIACAAFSGCNTASAEGNPFSDVDPSSWAYQAVAQLSNEGVVDGYPDGTFRGAKNVTRYEMAEIVGRLMTREDSLSADQKATVQKLSGEYADELKNLGVRVAEVEKKKGNLRTLIEWRVSGMNRYDNVYKDGKDHHYELGNRVRIHNSAEINPNMTFYSTIETYMSMNDHHMYDPHDSHHRNNDENDPSGDSDFNIHNLFTTYHFTKSEKKYTPFMTGPTNDIIAIGRFPVQMGVTGYTYQGSFSGISLQLGDYYKGGHFTIAYGRANDLNYDYIGPMMKGIHGLGRMMLPQITDAAIRNSLYGSGITESNPAWNTYYQAAQSRLAPVLNRIISNSSSIKELAENAQRAGFNLSSLGVSPALINDLNDMYDVRSDTLYPMGPEGVRMSNHEDQDVPVVYASYIFRKPDKWEAHAYGLKAIGPVGKIAKAWGFAGSWYPVGKWNIHGEYIKNMRKLPLNNERPYSVNFGISYGKADVLKAHSWQLGVDRVYSKAGTYFGGSSNDIADQYMGAVYRNWHGQRMPAYIADVIDDEMSGEGKHGQYGGAKFFLAKAQYVPMKGLIIEANYGFDAKDMGNRRMDNIFRIQATAYIM